MRLLRLTRRHPLALLGVIAVAFVGWIWWDALPESDSSLAPLTQRGEPGPSRTRDLPKPFAVMEIGASIEEGPGPAPDPTNVLTKLKPGMTRSEVERLVGAPAAEHVYPATIAEGRVTYQAAYEADFGPAPTVRPIRTPRALREAAPPRALVTLEFDATKPGHPLLDIYYPDPLF